MLINIYNPTRFLGEYILLTIFIVLEKILFAFVNAKKFNFYIVVFNYSLFYIINILYISSKCTILIPIQ